LFAHCEWLWYFAVGDINIQSKKNYVKSTLGINDESKLKNVFPEGIGSSGQWHTRNKYFEIKFNLLLIRLFKEKNDKSNNITKDEILDWIEKICLFKKYGQEFDSFQIPESFKEEMPEQVLAISNILLYVGFPDKYERISSDAHKKRILYSFSGLLSLKDREIEDKSIDEKILIIRNELSNITGKKDFDFYDDDYLKVWDNSTSQKDFSEVQGLQYKKAIILFGPPGTSKTYSAIRLANALITNKYLKNKENVKKYFEKTEDYLKDRIHRIQLHSNYNYEDFIAGIQLDNHSTKVVKGKIFEICDLAEKGKASNMPHVLILDEINRIDLSRLFGELFSAIENREEEINLVFPGLKLKIPSNLYIIGTMNEIDFSLERIDFALRRRFLWFFYGFNSEILLDIVKGKNESLKTKLKDEEIKHFINNATALNEEVVRIPELGKQYQIGHTFFAEVVNIYQSYKKLNSYTGQLKEQLYRKEGAAEILWDVSIEPILSAFLGNMDAESKKEKLKELKKIFLKK